MCRNLAYRGLCTNDTDGSRFLYGDDLSMNDTNRVASQLGGSSYYAHRAAPFSGRFFRTTQHAWKVGPNAGAASTPRPTLDTLQQQRRIGHLARPPTATPTLKLEVNADQAVTVPDSEHIPVYLGFPGRQNKTLLQQLAGSDF